VVIAFIVVYSGSIVPGILFHFVNNSVGLLLIRYASESELLFKRLGLGEAARRWLKGEAHVPWAVLVISAVVLAAGVVLLLAFRRKEQTPAVIRPAETGRSSDTSAQEIEKG
jgi:hypothetical protein